MVKTITLAALAVLAAIQAVEASGEERRVYYTSGTAQRRPAEVDAAAVFKKIPEYQEIKKKGWTRNDSEYWILLSKANDRFDAAVKKVARKGGYDCVTEKGDMEGKAADVTQEVIQALGK